MRKAILGISGAIILALALVLFVNARTGPGETKKASTELNSCCGKCTSGEVCNDYEKACKYKSDSAIVCCEKKQTGGTAEQCPGAGKATTSNSCGACPMSRRAVTQ